MPAMLTPSSKGAFLAQLLDTVSDRAGYCSQVTSLTCDAVWQHPFVDVFRSCGLKQWPQGNFAKEGSAKLAMVCAS